MLLTGPPTPATDRSVLQHAGRVARRIVDAAPWRIALARTADELEAVFRLRYRVVIERGWARPEDLPDGREWDAWDYRALQSAAWEGGTLVGATRIVLPLPGERFSVEEAFDLAVEPAGSVVELGRTCVDRRLAASRGRLFAALVSFAWLALRAHGFSAACGAFHPAVQRLYELSGIEVIRLGPSQVHLDEERFPVLVRPTMRSFEKRYWYLPIPGRRGRE